MQLVNRKNTSIKKCAFCKYWYDPTNSAIKPKDPRAGFWEFDERAKKMCLTRNIEMTAYENCHKYEGKI